MPEPAYLSLPVAVPANLPTGPGLDDVGRAAIVVMNDDLLDEGIILPGQQAQIES